MKTQGALVVMSVLASLALLGLIHVRHKEETKEEKNTSFQTIKLRVTQDVLGEYQHEVIRAHNLLDKTKAMVDILGQELLPLQDAAAQKKSQLNACQGETKKNTDTLAAIEAQISNSKTEIEKQKVSWESEVLSLKKQMEQRSRVCDFVKKDSEVSRTICGNKEEVAPKPEAPKAEAPKAEAPKAEAPKAEAPKAEAPKADAPKADAPKADAPKADAPKAEAPKAEAPKAEVPKADAPKPDVL
ncbi:hypothetical protein UPYG_G00156270 [Umbra pygmaea]|uniref:Uncharacterized protein n=1 Tax=Umbra pygmaea TaxID=75934 RepID=A0ABD0X2D6_UMBPY